MEMVMGMRRRILLPSLGLMMLGLLVRAGHIPGEAYNKTLTVGYLISWNLDWHLGGTMASAILIGIDKVKELGLLPGYNIEMRWRNTECKRLTGMRGVVEIWEEVEDLDVIIGGCCSVVCEPVSWLAAAWNLPVISYACGSSQLSLKKTHPTFTRTAFNFINFPPEFDAFADYFKWDRIAILANPWGVSRLVADELKRLMDSRGKRVFFHIMQETQIGDEKVDPEALQIVRDTVKSLKKEARIIFYYSYPIEMRVFLTEMYDAGMLNGDYFIYGIDVLYYAFEKINYRPELGLEIWVGSVDAKPILPTGPRWDKFAGEVIERLYDPVFDDPEINDYKLPRDADVNDVSFYAAPLHDAMVMWAIGVNKTLEQGGPPDDGLWVTKNVLNFTFEGVVDDVIRIDEVGDRLLDHVFKILQPDGSLVPIFHWYGATQKLVKVYKPDDPDDWTGIYWMGNATAPPTGHPPCGWDNEFCYVPDYTLRNSIVGAVLGGVIFFIMLGVTVSGYQRRKYELALQEALQYIISTSEVGMEEYKPIDSQQSLDNISSAAVGGPAFSLLRRKSVKREKVEEDVEPQMGVSGLEFVSALEDSTVRGLCRGNYVAVRKFAEVMISIGDRKILDEIKEAIEMQHENMAAFVGVVVEPRLVLVLMEWVDRGSLQDLIADDTTKLTWDLKISFVTDIIRGLQYIHGSTISTHGHLTSANCVVDKRWTVKLTDYGLTTIRRRERLYSPANAQGWSQLLWTAPELLRTRYEVNGTHKGDVYSYGIIVSEILTDGLPFGANFPPKDAQTTVTLVEDGSNPPYRPKIDPDLCSKNWRDMALVCWKEDPEERPTLQEILKMVQRINGGRLPRLVDSMISRLEQHTRNLEEIVAERSMELQAEKIKVEMVLAELLPRFVADQLKAGNPVAPETFDHVTLFFSDIVGFTRVSAQSTPMQVVTMLNKLYSIFDDILNKYDVYKVATIGDAYMVASGLPIRNGNRHASEIAQMSLALLETILDFPIPHLPHESLRMRIGLHSGSCVAAITGIKMPRYLLFGETIDIAARTEAGGLAQRVHVTKATALVLMETGGYLLEEREEPMEIKGVGSFQTYWLNGKA